MHSTLGFAKVQDTWEIWEIRMLGLIQTLVKLKWSSLVVSISSRFDL